MAKNFVEEMKNFNRIVGLLTNGPDAIHTTTHIFRVTEDVQKLVAEAASHLEAKNMTLATQAVVEAQKMIERKARYWIREHLSFEIGQGRYEQMLDDGLTDLNIINRLRSAVEELEMFVTKWSFDIEEFLVLRDRTNQLFTNAQDEFVRQQEKARRQVQKILEQEDSARRQKQHEKWLRRQARKASGHPNEVLEEVPTEAFLAIEAFSSLLNTANT